MVECLSSVYILGADHCTDGSRKRVRDAKICMGHYVHGCTTAMAASLSKKIFKHGSSKLKICLV